jgi:tripartite-type tricarboxylate transporter receptor subunit TctC
MVGDLAVQIATGEARIQAEDLVPLAGSMAGVDMWFVRSADARFQTFQDVVRHAKESTLSIAVTSPTGWDAVSVALVEKALGFTLRKVPFSEPALRYSSLAGGHVDLLFEQPGDVKGFLESGQFRPVLVVSERPVRGYPSAVTTQSLGIKPTLYYYRAVTVRKGTPKERVDKLADLFRRAMDTKEFREVAAKNEWDIVGDPALNKARITRLFIEYIELFRKLTR